MIKSSINLLKAISILSLIMLSNVSIFAQLESDFYTETNHLGITQNLVTDYGADGSDALDDSPALQSAIDYLTGLTNGGKIIIPAGTYYFAEIEMKSNVHLEIDASVTIIPTAGATGNYYIFAFGESSATVNNVSIRGSGGSYTVDFTSVVNTDVAVFRCRNVNNFLISDIDILDDITKFAAVVMGFTEYNSTYYIPTNGLIKNVTIEDAHYGYGLVQVQAANNLLFKDLSGKGGVTLRLESGSNAMNLLQPAGVGIFDIYGRNIHCEDGNTAVMFSPHAMQNGYFNFDGVTAINCGFAARVDNGFTTDEQATASLTPGYFDGTSVLTNVHATYGTTAQVKSKHFKYMACEVLGLVSASFNPDGESYAAPAITAVLYDAHGGNAAEGDWTATITNITQNGFVYEQETILVDSAAINDWQCNTVTAAFTHTNTNENFSFDGSGSNDSNGSIDGWFWNFGDGTTGTGEFPTHTFSTSGMYDVQLQVTDDVGATNSVFQTITAAVLPVELTIFEAKLLDENTVLLTWETATELNNKGFEIQRTTNNKDWETLDFINGNGTTLEQQSYTFIDESPLFGLNYYRLKQVDFDGTMDFSRVEVVNNKITSTLTIYPTLATNFINIKTIENTDNLKIQIFDLTGKMVLETTNTSKVDISNLARGQYFIRVFVGGNWSVERFLRI